MKIVPTFAIPNDKNGVYVAIDGEYAGFITLADSVKKEVKQTIKALKKRGIEKTIMLTGDSETSAKSVANQIEIDEYHHSLLPKDKADFAVKISPCRAFTSCPMPM